MSRKVFGLTWAPPVRLPVHRWALARSVQALERGRVRWGRPVPRGAEGRRDTAVRCREAPGTAPRSSRTTTRTRGYTPAPDHRGPLSLPHKDRL
jgi:hypothetical protein